MDGRAEDVLPASIPRRRGNCHRLRAWREWPRLVAGCSGGGLPLVTVTASHISQRGDWATIVRTTLRRLSFPCDAETVTNGRPLRVEGDA